MLNNSKKPTPMSRMKHISEKFIDLLKSHSLFLNEVNLNRTESKWSYETGELSRGVDSDFIKIIKINNKVSIGFSYYKITEDIENVLIELTIKTIKDDKGLDYEMKNKLYKYSDFKSKLEFCVNNLVTVFSLIENLNCEKLIKIVETNFNINEKGNIVLENLLQNELNSIKQEIDKEIELYNLYTNQYESIKEEFDKKKKNLQIKEKNTEKKYNIEELEAKLEEAKKQYKLDIKDYKTKTGFDKTKSEFEEANQKKTNKKRSLSFLIRNSISKVSINKNVKKQYTEILQKDYGDYIQN